MGGLQGCWGLEVIFEVTKAKISKSFNFNTFYNRIFVILNFEVVWPQRPRRPWKEPSEYFQRLRFWNQFVPLIKMHYRVRYSLDFDLKIRSGQVWTSCSLSLIRYVIAASELFAIFICTGSCEFIDFFFKKMLRLLNRFLVQGYYKVFRHLKCGICGSLLNVKKWCIKYKIFIDIIPTFPENFI